jgi:hypothetical protein
MDQPTERTYLDNFTVSTFCTGKYTIKSFFREPSNGAELFCPLIQRTAEQETILDLSQTLWSLCWANDRGHCLVLKLSKYPGNKKDEVVVVIGPDDNEFWIDHKCITHDELLRKFG